MHFHPISVHRWAFLNFAEGLIFEGPEQPHHTTPHLHTQFFFSCLSHYLPKLTSPQINQTPKTQVGGSFEVNPNEVPTLFARLAGRSWTRRDSSTSGGSGGHRRRKTKGSPFELTNVENWEDRRSARRGFDSTGVVLVAVFEETQPNQDSVTLH